MPLPKGSSDPRVAQHLTLSSQPYSHLVCAISPMLWLTCTGWCTMILSNRVTYLTVHKIELPTSQSPQCNLWELLMCSAHIVYNRGQLLFRGVWFIDILLHVLCVFINYIIITCHYIIVFINSIITWILSLASWGVITVWGKNEFPSIQHECLTVNAVMIHQQ